jgi:hypothetical protein
MTGPLPIELLEAADHLGQEDEEPISPAVLRASLEGLKLAAALTPFSTPEQRGKAGGRCEVAAIFLEGEMKRLGLLP